MTDLSLKSQNACNYMYNAVVTQSRVSNYRKFPVHFVLTVRFVFTVNKDGLHINKSVMPFVVCLLGSFKTISR